MAYDRCWIDAFFQLCYSTFLYQSRKGNHKAPQQLFPLQINIICSTLSVKPKRNWFITSVWLARLWPMTRCLLHSRLLAAFITDRDLDLFTTYRSPWKPRGLDQLCIWSVIHAVGTATASLSRFFNTTLEQNAEVQCRFYDFFDSLWIIDPIFHFCTALTNEM